MMHVMTRSLAIAASLSVWLTAAAMAQTAPAPASTERPHLRSEAIVTGDVVRIGDLIENAGIVANVPIFRAPDLGTTGFVPVSDVLDAVRSHALIGIDPGSVTEITVRRASREIPAKAIETAVTAALIDQYGLGEPSDVTLTFDRALRTLQVNPGAKGHVRVARVAYDQRSGRFDATLDIPGLGNAHPRLTGTVLVTSQVVTLARPLARGAVIKSVDIVSERRPRSELPADAMTRPDQAIGMSVRNALAAGRLLRHNDVMRPELVARNEAVTLVYEVPGITLTVRGRAVSSGAEGDLVEVLNVQSKRTVQGVVAGPGRVVVMTATPQIVASSEQPRNSR
jgi:flagella basal body P-ring formation protein FlgA